MKRWAGGFTIVELIIVIVIIGILAAISIVTYSGVTKMTVQSALVHTLKQAATATEIEAVRTGQPVVNLPEQVRTDADDDITLKLVPLDGSHYGTLSPVQKGVLFYNTCKELISDSKYSTIHAREGGATNNVMMSCDPGNTSIAYNSILIEGWDSKRWYTPITRQTLQSYVDSVPYDSWWTDRQAVIRDFYTALMDRFESSGGTWPITSFWDHWANQWSGVHKEELPALSSDAENGYCIIAVHKKYADMPYVITSTDGKPHEGSC